MKTPSDNPAENALPQGITLEQIDAAIQSSGYPLQRRVAEKLKATFELQEEWAYIDGETGDYRTLDILASRDLWDSGSKQPRVRPAVTLLIECKQAELPYVFFVGSIAREQPDLPKIVGLRHRLIELSAGNSHDTWNVDIPAVLGLHQHPLISNAPVQSPIFTRSARRGKDLELTGVDAYNGIVLPLVKALSHYVSISEPRDTFRYLECTAVLPIAVIDAPMIAVDVEGGGHTTAYAPWVRVLRQEPIPGAQVFETHRSFAIDCVHAAYLETYLRDHVQPFTDEFRKRVARHVGELYDGQGYVVDKSHIWARDIEPHVSHKRKARPKTVGASNHNPAGQ